MNKLSKVFSVLVLIITMSFALPAFASTVTTDGGYHSNVWLDADVLITKFSNKKGGGVLALYNDSGASKGLGVILYDAGNTDTLEVVTVGQYGKITMLKSVSLKNAILENVKYHLYVSVEVSNGQVLVSAIVTKPGNLTVGTLSYKSVLPSGVDAWGQVGTVLSTTSADTKVTNFTVQDWIAN